jgi:hypothetical protein
MHLQQLARDVDIASDLWPEVAACGRVLAEGLPGHVAHRSLATHQAVKQDHHRTSLIFIAILHQDLIL